MKRGAFYLAVAAMLALPAVALANDQTFATRLSPDNEVPPVTVPSEGSGRATVVIADDDSIDYEVRYADLTGDVMAAHIHFGSPDVAGPVMLPLAHGPSPMSGALSEADFMPVEDGPQTYAEALTTIRDGETYVNLHTMDNPSGEVRGQLEAEEPPDTSAALLPEGLAVGTMQMLLLAVAGATLLLGIRRFSLRRS